MNIREFNAIHYPINCYSYSGLQSRATRKKEDEHIHGAGQIGLIGAMALFGVDYFTSYYYATGEMMSTLHPYGLQEKAYITAGVIAFLVRRCKNSA